MMTEEPGAMGSDQPDVSVIIAAYNAVDYLETAVRSVLNQTDVSWELLIVDDGSNDGTLDLARALAATDPRVQPVALGVNRGPSCARNAGIARARGKWIAILDADDIFRETRLRDLLRKAECLEADLIADNQEIIDFETGSPISDAFPADWLDAPTPLTLEELVRRDTPRDYALLPLGYMKPLIRREFIVHKGVSYPPEHTIGEDFLFLVRCIRSGARVFLCSERGYVARRRARSLSRGDNSIHQRLISLNNQAINEADGSDVGVMHAFHRRRDALQFELFRHLLRTRSWGASFNAASQVSSRYLMERTLRAFSSRLAPQQL